MADPRIVREWLDKADEDFNFAKINLEERDNFYPHCLYRYPLSGSLADRLYKGESLNV